jgi:hypothetical protein
VEQHRTLAAPSPATAAHPTRGRRTCREAVARQARRRRVHGARVSRAQQAAEPRDAVNFVNFARRDPARPDEKGRPRNADGPFSADPDASFSGRCRAGSG